MDPVEADKLVRQLAVGFESLHIEYQKLYGQHQALERKLATAREQYNELAKLYGTAQTTTPPLSLASSPVPPREDSFAPKSTQEILETRPDQQSREAANLTRAALAAASTLKTFLSATLQTSPHGVRIWAGPAADNAEGSTCLMPSISESPLEQDFTVEGKPSQLGCPFASMSRKKLSSHAASVLSRYNASNSVGPHGSVAATSTALSSTSRINGRDSYSHRQSRRASFLDPIKADICGLSDHESPLVRAPSVRREESPEKASSEKPDNGEAGVCPIRFLDQHSPEEVATYFEKHKHELPRSHEVCVMRYQSNEDQIRKLDAKYGNLVSMIQGLGEKHKDMLPEEPDEPLEEDPGDIVDDAQVRKWASSISAQAPDANDEDETEDRQSHFERPLRDIRVGESPSRPWGIQVPAKYLEHAQSEVSSKPAHVAQAATPDIPPIHPPGPAQESSKRPAGKCPFGHGAPAETSDKKPAPMNPHEVDTPKAPANVRGATEAPILNHSSTKDTQQKPPQMVFSGPVFIGYSPEDAAKILSGLKMG